MLTPSYVEKILIRSIDNALEKSLPLYNRKGILLEKIELERIKYILFRKMEFEQNHDRIYKEKRNSIVRSKL